MTLGKRSNRLKSTTRSGQSSARAISFADWWNGLTGLSKAVAGVVAPLLVILGGGAAYSQWIGWIPASKMYVEEVVEKANKPVLQSVWDLQLDSLSAQRDAARRELAAVKAQRDLTKAPSEVRNLDVKIQEKEEALGKIIDRIKSLEGKLGR